MKRDHDYSSLTHSYHHRCPGPRLEHRESHEGSRWAAYDRLTARAYVFASVVIVVALIVAAQLGAGR